MNTELQQLMELYEKKLGSSTPSKNSKQKLKIDQKIACWTLDKLGWSARRIGILLYLSHNTVTKYILEAEKLLILNEISCEEEPRKTIVPLDTKAAGEWGGLITWQDEQRELNAEAEDHNEIEDDFNEQEDD